MKIKSINVGETQTTIEFYADSAFTIPNEIYSRLKKYIINQYLDENEPDYEEED